MSHYSHFPTQLIAHLNIIYGALGVFIYVCIKIVFKMNYTYNTNILIHIVALYMYVYCGSINLFLSVILI
jgi:hypothetical protein